MLFPDYYYDSAYKIPYDKLFENGKKAVLFDLDNTLVEHGAPADDRAVGFVKGLMDMGYRVLFISNNKENRVKAFNERIGADYIYKAGKPGARNYLVACEKLGVKPSEAIFVGDQIFTDIWGANRAGLESYLVKRIAFHEEIQIHIKRIFEAPILALFCIFRRKKWIK